MILISLYVRGVGGAESDKKLALKFFSKYKPDIVPIQETM